MPFELLVENPKGSGDYETVALGTQGAPGPPGPASPHAGSNIATSAKAWGAVGDGVTDDTAAIQDAIDAAGPGGYLDFEAGRYKVTAPLTGFWDVTRDGPGILTDGTTDHHIRPRSDEVTTTLHVNGSTGNDGHEGIFPTRPMRSLAALNRAFAGMSSMESGTWVIRLSGTIIGGVRFKNLPTAKAFISFQGDGDFPSTSMSKARPSTWIVRDQSAADIDRFGMRFEEGEGSRIELANIGFRGFNAGGGDAGWIMKSGGFIRTWNCWTEDCSIGSIYTGNVGFSELYSTHAGYTTSGTRAQYNSSGSWTGVKCLGGPNAFEGFHVSRQSVCHVDDCLSENHTTWGAWSDMSTRVSYERDTIRNNGSAGIRGQGSADVQIDSATTFANNGRQHVSLRGVARDALEEGIFATPEHLVDVRMFSDRSTALPSDRTFKAFRIGSGARLSFRVVGTGGGTMTIAGGGTTFGGVTVPSGNWALDLVAQHDGSRWQTYATVNGGAPIFGAPAAGSTDIKPTFTPSGGATFRGIEFRTGG